MLSPKLLLDSNLKDVLFGEHLHLSQDFRPGTVWADPPKLGLVEPSVGRRRLS